MSLNSSDSALVMDQDFPADSSRIEPEPRPNVVRRNSDGDVKILSSDDNFVGSSGARDDSDLYMTKSLVCKPDTSLSPAKGLLANGLDRKSNEMVGDSRENNKFDQNETAEFKDKVEDSCENNSIDQDNGLKYCENTVFDQNGISGKNDSRSENINTDACEALRPEGNTNLADSMISSSNTVVEEDSNTSNIEEVKITKIGNGLLVSEKSLERTRPVSKAITCRSNHRLNHSSKHDLNGDHIGSHVSNAENSFGESGVTLKSPKEQALNKLQKYLDIDGLSLVVDPVQARLVKLERCYREKIQGLETQLQGCICGLDQKISIKQDMVRTRFPS